MKELVFIFFLLPSLVWAQNLVPNPSFEEFTICPDDALDIDFLSNWRRYFSSNYYNECGTNGFGAPQNVFGFQEPHSDAGYVGIYTFVTPSPAREYVWVELLDTLQADKYYWVKFYISLSDSVWYSTKNIGAYFSINQKPENRDTLLSLKPQVFYTGEEFLTERENWIEISGRFKAYGGEKYMIIGNFDDDTKTDTLFVNGAQDYPNPHYYTTAYYYIDDVSVELDTTTSIHEYGFEDQLNLYPNPNDGNMYLEYTNLATDARFQLYDIAGRRVAEYRLQERDNKINISENLLQNGLYVYRVIDSNDTQLLTGKVVITK